MPAIRTKNVYRNNLNITLVQYSSGLVHIIETIRPKYYDKAENRRAEMMIRPKILISPVSDRTYLNILDNTPPMLQTSDFGRSDQYCHMSDIYIIKPIKCRPED